MKEKKEEFYQKTSGKWSCYEHNMMMSQLLKQQSAPKIEVDVFDGNPI